MTWCVRAHAFTSPFQTDTLWLSFNCIYDVIYVEFYILTLWECATAAAPTALPQPEQQPVQCTVYTAQKSNAKTRTQHGAPCLCLFFLAIFKSIFHSIKWATFVELAFFPSRCCALSNAFAKHITSSILCSAFIFLFCKLLLIECNLDI